MHRTHSHHVTASLRTIQCVWFAAVLWLAACLCGQSTGQPAAPDVAAKLDALKESIAAKVKASLQRTNYNSSYTIVWRAYEDAVIDALCSILPEHISELKEKNFDRGRSGREKNRLADLAIVCGTNQIEISIKTARRSGNPENDLGTFHEYPNRKKLFAASFTLWVRYDDASKEIRAERVFFDRSYTFVGKSTLVDGVKYRKKDGNMRPKPWAMFDAGTSYWKSEEEFESAVKRSETYRANEIIKEHLGDLDESDQRLLYERLKQKFGDQKPATP